MTKEGANLAVNHNTNNAGPHADHLRAWGGVQLPHRESKGPASQAREGRPAQITQHGLRVVPCDGTA